MVVFASVAAAALGGPYSDPSVRVGPPPELAAVRRAVEEANRHGENVDEVRRALADLERAMVGRAWTRPPVVPDPPPWPPPPAAAPPAPFAADLLNPDDPQAVARAMGEVNRMLRDALSVRPPTIRARPRPPAAPRVWAADAPLAADVNGVRYEVYRGADRSVSRVVVRDGAVTHVFDSLDRVPAKYQAGVRRAVRW